jgi:hypothetical protein
MLSLAFFGRGWVPLAMAGRVAEGGFGSGGGGVRTLFSACDGGRDESAQNLESPAQNGLSAKTESRSDSINPCQNDYSIVHSIIAVAL